MKIIDLLEELQKHGEEEIEFMIFDIDGKEIKKLQVYTIDGYCIFKKKNNKLADTIILAFMEN